MKTFSRFLLVSALLVSALLAACASSPAARGSSSAEPATCRDLQASAAAEVSRVVSSHTACQTDSDCIEVAVGAACFDHCSRAMNATGKDELEAARQRMNDTSCLEFGKRGCKSFSPPCMALPHPRCRAGSCA